MSGDSVPLREHLAALRAADQQLAAERLAHAKEMREADQRALDIKDKADEAALELARVDRLYKDEKANNLREQIASERNLYPTKSQLYGYLIGAAAVGAAIAAIFKK